MESFGIENKLIFVAIYIVMGVGFLFIGITFLRLRAKLREQGKRATAEVTGVTTKRVTRNKRSVTKYVCALEFRAGSAAQTVKYTTEQPRSVGEKIEITYLPDKPSKFIETGQLTDSAANKILPLIPVVIGVILLIAGAVAAFR